MTNLAEAKQKPNCKKNPIQCHILKNNPKAKKSLELSDYIVKSAKKHDISPKLLSAIFMQESSYDQHAMVRQCGIGHAKFNEIDCVFIDVGIGQINYKTIDAKGLSVFVLLNDLEYAVEASADILGWFKTKYSKREPNRWFCRYNTGTASASKIKKNCDKYLKLVRRYL